MRGMSPEDIISEIHMTRPILVEVDRTHEQARFIDAALKRCTVRGCKKWVGEPDFEHPHIIDNEEQMCAEHFSNLQSWRTHAASK